MGLRQNSDIIKGGKIMVFVGGNPIAFATNHTLSLTRNTQEISSKDHGDASAIIPTTQSWEVTSENLMSTAGYAPILAAYINKDQVGIYFLSTTYRNNTTETGIVGDDGGSNNWSIEQWADPSTANSLNLTGKAYITSLNVNAPSGDNATFTVTFTGTGQIGRL